MLVDDSAERHGDDDLLCDKVDGKVREGAGQQLASKCRKPLTLSIGTVFDRMTQSLLSSCHIRVAVQDKSPKQALYVAHPIPLYMQPRALEALADPTAGRGDHVDADCARLVLGCGTLDAHVFVQVIGGGLKRQHERRAACCLSSTLFL